MRCTLPVLIAALTLPAVWAVSATHAVAEKKDEATGYTVSLFNGENLYGWHANGCEAQVANGTLKLAKGNGVLRTDHRYGDFVLELKWKPGKDQASAAGVVFGADLASKAGGKSYVVSLKPGEEGAVARLEGAKARPDQVKAGQWNTLRLSVTGKQINLDINGQPAWKASGVTVPTGHLGLQAEVAEGSSVAFRDLTVTELTHRSMFNGRDLSGWEPGAGTEATSWTVEDGLLVCNGKKGPWLRSSEQYGDFNMRLDYKLLPGGNSGVYVRVPKNGDHRGASANQKVAGVEIQILDDQSPRYTNLKDYQYCGSVYAIAPSTQRVGREAGQWNSMEIDCRGTRYRIALNGVVIVDADAKEFPELAQRLTEGYLGLQNHSEEVWFRNLRVGPSQQ